MMRNNTHCLYSHFDVCVKFVRVIIHVFCEFQIVRIISRNFCHMKFNVTGCLDCSTTS